VKNPRRNLTVGLLLGTFSVMVLYLIVNLAYMYVLRFGSSRLLAVASDALELTLGTAGGTIVALAILISISVP